MKKRLVVAISGASGLLLGRALLDCVTSPEMCEKENLEVHLIISRAAREVAVHEGREGKTVLEEMERLAHAAYEPEDCSAPMASGSWRHAGMVVCPCSMASLAAIASGVGTNLIHRAADVCLKERTPLVLVPRETPLSRVHLRNMLAAQEAGAVIMPPSPAYYTGLSSLEEAAAHFAVRVLDQLGLQGPETARWKD